MSISGSTKPNSSSNMETTTTTPFFHEFKKQAYFYIKEKIKTARLALTDVTPAQLLTKEATNEDPWAPDNRSLGLISRAAFEVDDYWRIVDILHHKLLRFDRKNWRPSYKALIVLEHMMTYGPESAAQEFQCDLHVIQEMQTFQHVDEKGFNWGLAVRKKAERVAELLERGPLLKEERKRVRSVTRGIQGFGSFSETSSSAHEIPRDYVRSHSQFHEHGEQEDSDALAPENMEKPKSSIAGATLRENNAPSTTTAGGDLHSWNDEEEGESLLSGNVKGTNRMSLAEEEDHPFYKSEKQTSHSLLAAREDD